MNKLDEYQNKAVNAPIEGKKICVVAGAGSGKTTTLVARINHLISNGVEPKDIVCITFTNSASETIKSRITEQVGYVGTLHSAMFRILKKQNPELLVLPDETSLEILHKYATQLRFKKKSRKFLSIQRRVFWKSDTNEGESSSINKLKQLYLNHVQSINAYDYDTILLAGLSMIKEDKSLFPCKYLLVDEYQDSSEIDLEIYKNLCESQFVVGDPRQAIYGFRGDSAVSFEDIEKEFDELNYLPNNYRSNDKIVSLANQIQSSFGEMKSMLPESKGKSLFFAELEDEYDELHFITNFLNQSNEETAILCRTNSERIRVEAYLEERGIPYDSNKTLSALDDFWKIDYLLNLYDNPHSKTASEMYLRKLEPAKSEGYYLSSLDAMPLVKKESDYNIVRFLYENGVSKLTLSELSGRIENFEEITDTFEFSQSINSAKQSARVDNDLNIFVGTMHSSKSKEWDNVIIPFCNEDKIPLRNQDIEQERNLFYVACTRARHKIVISCAKKVNDGYSDVDLIHSKPSRFVDSLIMEESIKIEHLHK